MDDMLETMYLLLVLVSTVQVGILKRLIVIDISKAEEKKHPLFPLIQKLYIGQKKLQYMKKGLSTRTICEIERPAECRLKYIDYDGKEKGVTCQWTFGYLCST